MKTVLFPFICCLLHVCLGAQPGTLDSSFAGNGITLNENSSLYCVAIQKSGKIIVGGAASSDGFLGSGLLRYNIDGSIDSSFGKNGYAILNYDVANQGPFSSIDILPDNKIIATSAGSNIFTAKFTAEGKPDSSFGTNGYVLNHFAFVESISDIVVQDDGKILVGGAITTSFTDPFYGIMVCYTPEGKLDLAFGDSGKVVLTQSTGLSSIAIQKDGKIITGGTADVGESEFYVGRLNTDGSYDKSFGDRGYVYTRFFKNKRDGLASIALQPDGKLLAAGYCNSFGLNQDIGIARYSGNGNLDNSFGVDGLTNIHVYNSSEASTVLLQKDGKIILSGRTFDDIAFRSDAVLVRLSSDGFIDSSFASNGIAVTDFSNGGYDSEYGAVLQADGKVVTTGKSDFRTGINFGNIARYNNDETKKQIIIKKIKHYTATHNNAQATSLNNVSIYPNPAQNVLHVVGLSSTKTKLTVVDIAGNIKLQAVANTSSYNLNIASFNAGSYLLKIEMNGVVVMKKFVKG